MSKNNIPGCPLVFEWNDLYVCVVDWDHLEVERDPSGQDLWTFEKVMS